MKLLATADLHLGRRPSRIPDVVTSSDVLRASEAAWRDVVDLAVRDRVDAVLVAGDLVEHDDDLFEAFPHLLEAGRRLADAGIAWILVSGNHDARVLPRLLRDVPHATHLGADGRWETVTLQGRDGTAIDVVGWSFPADGAPVDTSPVSSLPANLLRTSAPPERPVVGLLHGDLDAGRSRYAPVSRRSLQETHASAWLLGHVHVPTFGPPGSRSTTEPVHGRHRWGDGTPPPVGYLGSLVGTDPGETGGRGPWRIDVGVDGTIDYRHLHRAPLVWTECTIDVSRIATPDDVASSVLGAARDPFSGDRTSRDRTSPDRTSGDRAWDRVPTAVGVRVTVAGRHPQARELRTAIDRIARQERSIVVPSADGTWSFVHAVHHDVRSAVDLERLARDDDPVGLLARRLLWLDDLDDPRTRSTIDEARPSLEAIWNDRTFDLAPPQPLDDDRIAAALRSAGWEALDALLATKEPRG